MINISKLYCGRAGESDTLRYSAKDSSGPVVVYNCTSKCNLKCLHCYSSSQTNQRDDELDTTQAKKLLTQLAEVNCPVVLFSGGEPLLREDLFELLVEAKRLDLRTVISTNGTLIDSAAADRLAKAGVSYAGISIDGDEESHDKFRASKGSFKAAVRGIENCQKAGIKTGLRFTITKSNAGQIPFVFALAASTGTRRICFYHLIRTGRAKELNNQTLTPQRTRQAVDTIIEKTKEFVQKDLIGEVLTVGNHADGPFLLMKLKEFSRRRYGDVFSPQACLGVIEECQKLLTLHGGNKTGEKIACVSWDGSVHPDQFWRNYSLGNTKDKTFKAIWENPDELVLKKLRNKSKFADIRCLKCKWFDLCKGNFRFLGPDPADKNWLLEPPCYLTDQEIT
ncbi:MAG: radical SAM protein [Sedimentisphaerales bacterium]|nr:radical SAM protein [Sedimentisphaerales bacterium]